MKIQSTSSNPLVNAVSGGTRAEAAGHAGAAPGGTQRRGDVDLSPAARHLAALQDGHADVRTERVRQIQDALASGELKIDTGRIADSLLTSVRELLK